MSTLKVDVNAGLIVALVLIPQSMANAQLAGLPAYHGIYAAFLPALVGGIWGSSRQMVTGSVAVTSLMAAAALEPIAVSGPAGYVAYMALLTLMVGGTQLLFGVFRLGMLVNFLSLPVISGFTNAAAVIIASTQLSKLLGVTVDSSPYQYETVLNVIASAWNYTHTPSVLMALFTAVLLFAAKKYAPKAPAVLFAVAITTLFSWLIGFERTTTASIFEVANDEARVLLVSLVRHEGELQEAKKAVQNLEEALQKNPASSLEIGYKIDEYKLVQEHIRLNMSQVREHLRQMLFVADEREDGTRVFTVSHSPGLVPELGQVNSTKRFVYFPFAKKNATAGATASTALDRQNGTVGLGAYAGSMGHNMAALLGGLAAGQASSNGTQPYVVYESKQPAESFTDGRVWRLQLGQGAPSLDTLTFSSGGAVIGKMQAGLVLQAPSFSWEGFMLLLPNALIIAFIGFAESISIGKAAAKRFGYRIDPNQELVGQGLANIAGGFSLTSPVSGSFSVSAVNMDAGAKTGVSCVVASLGALSALLFFTGPLSYVPQPVLAVIVCRAAWGLLSFKEFKRVWTVQWYDGVVALVTFCATLYFAPHLDYAVGVGVVLSLAGFFFRSMYPHIVELSVGPDRMLRDAGSHNLPLCRHIAIINFQGPLFFANSQILESYILKKLEVEKDLRHIHLVCSGITGIDASGEDTLASLVKRIQAKGLSVSFSGVVGAVADVFVRSGIWGLVGGHNIFVTPRAAICAIHRQIQHDAHCKECPLSSIACYPNEFVFGPLGTKNA